MNNRFRQARLALGVALAAGLALAGGGCEADSWMLDPSVIGRWEHTPTSVPILTRIAAIEGPEDEWVEVTDPTPADLVPEISEYRIGPGDRLNITVFDLPEEGRPSLYEGKLVDTRGYIDLPQLGAINVNGLTVSEAVAAIQEAMRPLVNQPLATVDVLQQRQQRYSVFGQVVSPGSFFIPAAEFRLLEALTLAGGFSEQPEAIYVIRQTPLTEAASGRPPAAPRPGEGTPPTPEGPQLENLIEELTRPRQQDPGQPADPQRPGGSPGVFQPGQPPEQPARPPIDLITPGQPAAPIPQPETPQRPSQPDTGDTTWVYLNGQWVEVKRPATPAQPAAEAPTPAGLPAAGTQPGSLITQRVIRIPLARLASGDGRVNIVIRPGDIIRVPPPPAGNFFMGGQINRPGVYQLSDRMTLTNAIVAAGGLSAIAVPERVDISRMVGRDRVATIRVNLRAIFERTEPDIYLKANDRIDIGTNFWATPLAVIRNGFRASYGFGLLVDRNFGNDIFGPPPEENPFN